MQVDVETLRDLLSAMQLPPGEQELVEPPSDDPVELAFALIEVHVGHGYQVTVFPISCIDAKFASARQAVGSLSL